MIQSDIIKLYHFESYFLFSIFRFFFYFKILTNEKNLKKENILKIENMIQSDIIELYHFVSYF